MSANKLQQLNSEFVKEIADIMLQLTGVQFFDKQSGMIQSRLFKRMIELNMKEPTAYLKYLKENYSTESKVLVSLLTTHHTFFFREFFHFDFLLKEGLTKIIAELRSQNQTKIRIWSAACSQGQEVYSLALFLDYHLPLIAPDISYEILGTDIDIDCIKIAKNGVYRFEQIKEIPSLYQGKHWQKGTGDIENFVRVKDNIRSHCQFMTSNLFDMSLLMGQNFHFIFCRNVFIYFNQIQINSVAKNMLNLLHPGGYLFLGLSESLNGVDVTVEQSGPSIYLKPKPEGLAKQGAFKPPVQPAAPAIEKVAPIRVVCVDDSPIILTLLKKILTAEYGFDVVATASNGMEAREVIQKLKPDVVTLDIHMPLMTGVDYLRQFHSDSHPPVIMVSSVSREEVEYGVESLVLGATDFIEKPSLSTLQEKSEEIRLKLRCAHSFHTQSSKEDLIELVKKFKVDFSAVDNTGLVRVSVSGLGEMQKIRTMVSQMGEKFPPFVILLHGAQSFVPLLVEKMKDLKVQRLEDHVVLKSNHIYLASFDQCDMVNKMLSVQNHCHFFVVGDTPPDIAAKVSRMKEITLFQEENLNLTSKSSYQILQKAAFEVLPYTSLIYHSSKSMMGKIKKVAA
jgi:chemotaxis protein methyltransferase CheR